MITVLIAIGANNIEIPCRVFECMEDARLSCDHVFPNPPETNIEGTAYYSYDAEEDDDSFISDWLFTRHYYGCGGPFAFILKTIPFNSSFVGFDLD